jgi:hypothetical protein
LDNLILLLALLPKRVGAGLDSQGMGPPGSLARKDLRDPQGALQIPPLRFASVGMTRGGRLLLARLATWMDGIRSGYAARTADPSTALRFGRDDKGRVIAHLKVCESDRELFRAIRLGEVNVRNCPRDLQCASAGRNSPRGSAMDGTAVPLPNLHKAGKDCFCTGVAAKVWMKRLCTF